MWLVIPGHDLPNNPNPPTMGMGASRPGRRGTGVEDNEEDVQPGVQDGRGAGRDQGREDPQPGGVADRKSVV